VSPIHGGTGLAGGSSSSDGTGLRGGGRLTLGQDAVEQVVGRVGHGAAAVEQNRSKRSDALQLHRSGDEIDL
jgi:hypothetical protein